MKPSGLVALAAAAMLASVAFPWFVGPSGPVPTLYELGSGFWRGTQNGDAATAQLLQAPPLELLLLVAGYGLAALLLLLSIFGAASRILALLSGLAPFGALGLLLFRPAPAEGALAGLTSAGSPGAILRQAVSELSFADLASGLADLAKLAEPAFWLLWGGALALLLFTLVLPRRR